MKKEDELRNPNSCFNKAAHDEPIFVLRANDPIAAQTVRLWVAMAHQIHQEEKLEEAQYLANMMEEHLNKQPQAAPIPTENKKYEIRHVT